MELLRIDTGTRQDCSYTVYLPDSYEQNEAAYSTIFVQDGNFFEKLARDVLAPLPSGGQTEQIVVGVSSPDRMDAYSPWPAPPLNPRFPSFGGHGFDYLHFLAEDLLPFLRARYRMRMDSAHTAITGFSLGGLIALYALYTVPVFGKIAAISPSCWYPGWIDFIEKKKPMVLDSRVLLVAGRDEGDNRPQPLSHTPQDVEHTRAILTTQLDQPPAPVVWDDGIHLQYQKERQQTAFRWLFASDAWHSSK